MTVNLKTLIKAVPFKEETRQDLLKRLDSLTETQKIDLSDTCWAVLAQMYFARLRYEKGKLMLEIQQGKREFNKQDFEEVKEKITKQFAKRLKSVQTEESIEQIRQKLQQQVRKK